MEIKHKDKSSVANADVQDSSWKSLNVAAIAVIFLNSTLYFLITEGLTRTLVLNIFFLIVAIACHNNFLNISLYRFESSKLKLATQRRKAVLLGISFRENFQFPTAGSMLGGTKTILRLTLVVSLFAATFYTRDYLGLSLLSWGMGLLMLFALSPTWLWIPVLFSMFFLGVGSHQNYGARHIVSFLTLTMIGIQCLLFAWHVGNRLESIKLQFTRTPSKQNRSQVALLALAFVGISTTVFIFIPKQLNVGKFQFSKSTHQRMTERAQTDEFGQFDWFKKDSGRQSGSETTFNSDQGPHKPGSRTKTVSNSQSSSGAGSGTGPGSSKASSNGSGSTSNNITGSDPQSASGNRSGSSNSISNGSGSSSNDNESSNPSSEGSGNEKQASSGGDATNASANSGGSPQDAGNDSDSSGKATEENSEEQPNMGSGSGKEVTSKETLKRPPNKETKKGGETKKPNAISKNTPSSQKPNGSSRGAEKSFEKQTADTNTQGKKTGESKTAAASTSKVRKESVPEKKIPEKIENKRLLRSIIIISTVLLIGLILLMIAKRKKPKKPTDSPSEKDLPTKSEIAQAMQKFKAEYKAIIAAAKNQEDIRVLVVELYNLLLTHYDGCGLGKPSYATPDEFHRNEYIYRTWSKSALAHVTETFNKVFYGNKLPAAKDFTTYCDNVAQLGQMLAKIAPYKAN